MQCPKCGGEIPFYDLKPNCKHCGVNIMYYTQEEGLIRDAKRTELESAVARMVIARIKASFIGSKLVIFRMIFVLLSVAVLLIPFGSMKVSVPFYEGGFSAGLLGVIQIFRNGTLMLIPKFLGSALFSGQMLSVCVPLAVMVIIVLIDAVMLVMLILSFLNIDKFAKLMKNVALAGAIAALCGQIASTVSCLVSESSNIASDSIGFGSLAACAVFVVLFIMNRAVLKKGIEPQYRENDLKRKELLKKVRAGEVDLDSLPIPIFENDTEREERMKALKEALIAEEEGKEL